jgi:glycosyltransferase involved in cell wall biosynthesis
LNSRLNILFLPRWYPHRYDPMPGLFIQKQAEAVSAFCDVAVIYVHEDKNAVNLYEVDFAVENGITVVRIYYRESRSSVFSGILKMWRFLYAHFLGFRMLQSFHPDLVHVHVLTREGVIAWIYKVWKKTPYVITEHWSRYLSASDCFHGALLKWVTRKIVNSSSAMIAVSEKLKNAMQRFSLQNKNFVVVANPVETGLFTMRMKPGKRNVKRFIHISCFEDRPKNISGLLNVVKNLSASRSDFECYFIGDGPEFELWKSKAVELGLLGKFVYFIGLKEQHDLVTEIQSSDFMVLSSNYETFGTVVIECLSCGIPVVATNVGIVSEVINESNGIIIPAQDNKALENAVNEMLDRCDSYDPQVIRDSVMTKFDSETIARQLVEIYQKSLNSKQKIS